MNKKIHVGDELATSLKVDGFQFSPVCTMLSGREISKVDIGKIFNAYSALRKDHPRIMDIKAHIAAVLEAMVIEPLTPLGRSVRFEDQGIDFHVMQVTLWSSEKPTFSAVLKDCFKPISVTGFRKLLGKG